MIDYQSQPKKPFDGVNAAPVVAMCIKIAYYNAGWTNDTKLEEVVQSDPEFATIRQTAGYLISWLGIEPQVITVDDVGYLIAGPSYQRLGSSFARQHFYKIKKK